jgi:hypothetical protein
MRRHHHQEMPVMNIVWPITAWYLGPLALWAYWHIGHLKIGSHTRVDRSEISVETESVPHHIIETHKSKVEDKSKEVKPFWETIFVSATHCGAGCTLGDVISEWSIFLAGVTLAGSVLYASFIFDFTIAWLLGIIFQYVAIIQMQKMRLGVRSLVLIFEVICIFPYINSQEWD